MSTFPPINILTTEAQVKDYYHHLRESSISSIAMDIEGEFNLHCYGEHLCLVQIFDGSEIIIIDPMGLKDWKYIQAIFEEPQLEKIVYDRSSDASLLYNKYGISYLNTTDLRVAVALLEVPKQGLSSVLEDFLGVVGENKKKFQRYNWISRPLDRDALRYAAEDVTYLFTLRDKLFARLKKQNLIEQFFKENDRLNKQPIKDNSKDRHKRAKGYRGLNKRQQERFAKLFKERDRIAQIVNLPPDRVFKNQKLLEWCKRDIYSKEAATKIISHRVSAKDRAEFLQVLTGKVR